MVPGLLRLPREKRLGFRPVENIQLPKQLLALVGKVSLAFKKVASGLCADLMDRTKGINTELRLPSSIFWKTNFRKKPKHTSKSKKLKS